MGFQEGIKQTNNCKVSPCMKFSNLHEFKNISEQDEIRKSQLATALDSQKYKV